MIVTLYQNTVAPVFFSTAITKQICKQCTKLYIYLIMAAFLTVVKTMKTANTSTQNQRRGNFNSMLPQSTGSSSL